MFLRNEMKLLIIFIFLAAAASLGLAKEPTHKPSSVKLDSSTHQPESPTNQTDSSTYQPESPTNQPESPTNQTDSPTDKPDSSTGASGIQTLAGIAKSASDPLSALLKLSPQCQAALFDVVANPEFLTCIPVDKMFTLLPLLGDPSALKGLLKDPIHKLPPLLTPVLDAVCAAPKCSDKGVSESLKAVKEGCKKDAKDPLIVMVTGAITFYSPVRDIACFKTNKKEYCVFDTLGKILTLPKPPISITGTFIDNVAFAEPKFICTPCNKAIFNTAFNFLNADTNHCVEYLQSIKVPQFLITIVKLGAAVKCGFQFLDGDVGHPEKTDPDDFEYQLSSSGASNLKGISFVAMIGALLASILMI